MATCEYSKCGRELPPGATKRRKFCDDDCRRAAFAERNSIVLPEGVDQPDAVADAYLAPKEPVEQLAIAVLHARSLSRVFLRLSRTAPAPVAWRSANVGIDLSDSLDSNFPDVDE